MIALQIPEIRPTLVPGQRAKRVILAPPAAVASAARVTTAAGATSAAGGAPTTHARVRILKTADRLFSSGGIHTIGVDRVIAETQVTKATLYKYFPSKDALIVAYLRTRDQQIRTTLTRIEHENDTPSACLRALISLVAAEAVREDFTGCPFINTTAQFDNPSHPARTVIAEHRSWYTRTVHNLFRGSGHPRPAEATTEYLLARDGLYSSANLGDARAARQAFLRSIHRVMSETIH